MNKFIFLSFLRRWRRLAVLRSGPSIWSVWARVTEMSGRPKSRTFSTTKQVKLVGEVAGPGLEGGQVAVLRPHAASAGHVMNAAYACLRELYVLQRTKLEL